MTLNASTYFGERILFKLQILIHGKQKNKCIYRVYEYTNNQK